MSFSSIKVMTALRKKADEYRRQLAELEKAKDQKNPLEGEDPKKVTSNTDAVKIDLQSKQETSKTYSRNQNLGKAESDPLKEWRSSILSLITGRSYYR